MKKNIDEELDFIQIDRDAEQIAAVLQGQSGYTFQHAIGSLYRFWRTIGKPRELRRIIGEIGENETPIVSLSAEKIEDVWELSSGKRLPVKCLCWSD